MNNKALKFFADVAQKKNISQTAVKFSKKNDFTHYDADFILNFVDENSEILDVGSGTGLIVNKLYQHVKFIEAVEPFEAYSKFIVRSDKIHVVNVTADTYRIDRQFDFLLCFGFCQYLSSDEAGIFYKKFYQALKPNGKIIVKNQFGIKEDVLVDNFSEEIKAMYFSEYRTLEHEKCLLADAGFKNHQVCDIYPAECSHWENTHYYAIVAEK